MASPEIIDHDGTNYVTGLFWQTLDNLDRQQRESRELAEELGFDRVSLIDYPALQAGYAEKGQLPEQWQKSSNLYSLAGHLAMSEPGSWVGIFPLGQNRYYFFAINKDVILPEGDFVGNKEQVEDKLQEVRNQGGGWSAIYAPEKFGNFRERSLSSLLDDTEDPPPLSPTRFEITKEFMVRAGSTIALALAFAVMLYMFGPTVSEYVVGSGGEPVVVEKETKETKTKTVTKKKVVEDTGPEEPTKDVEKDTEPKEPVYTPPPAEGKNWRTAQRTQDLIPTCEKFYNTTPFYQNSWAIRKWTCGPLHIKAVYKPVEKAGPGAVGPPPTLGKPQEVHRLKDGVEVRLRVADAYDTPPKGYPEPEQFIAQLRYRTPFSLSVKRTKAAENQRSGLEVAKLSWSQDVPPFELLTSNKASMMNNEAFRLLSISRQFQGDRKARPSSATGFGGNDRPKEAQSNGDQKGTWTIEGALYHYGEVNSIGR